MDEPSSDASAGAPDPQPASAPGARGGPEPPGPRPAPPGPNECCGTACDPCIWTWHQRAVARWEERVEAWNAAAGDA